MSDGKWGYNTLRAQGRCGWCGKPPIEGKSLCAPCSIKAQRKNAEWRARKAKREQGDDVLAPGSKLGRLTDRALLADGRCKCGLLLPCVCLPASASGWRAYAGGPSE